MELLKLIVLLFVSCGHIFAGIYATPAADELPQNDASYGHMGEPCTKSPFRNTEEDDLSKEPWPRLLPVQPSDARSLHPRFRSSGLPSCLRNADKCREGFSAVITFSTDVKDVYHNSTAIDFVPRTINGDIAQSDVAIRLTFQPTFETGEFEVRVRAGDKLWTVGFLATLGYPVLVGLHWKEEMGLYVYIDGICIGFDLEGRRFIGIYDENVGVTFTPAELLLFANYLKPLQTSLEMEDILRTYYLGCLTQEYGIKSFKAITDLSSKDILASCRRSCWKLNYPFAFVSGILCQCGNEVGQLEMSPRCGVECEGYFALPCGSEDGYTSAYITSSLRKTRRIKSYTKELVESSNYLHNVHTKHQTTMFSSHVHGRTRIRRSADSEDDFVHHRHRRNAEFIEVDDVSSLEDTIVNVTYLMYATTEITCVWNFGDGGGSHSQTNAERSAVYQYAFPNPGRFTITVNCGEFSGTAPALIKSSLVGHTFTMAQSSETTSPSDDVILQVTSSTSSWPVGASFLLDGKLSEFVDSSGIFTTYWTADEYGFFEVNATISNGIQEDIAVSATVTVGEEITGLQLKTSGQLGTNSPIMISVEISGGSAVRLDMDFGNGNTITSEYMAERVVTWTEMYSSPGAKTITVSATNALGSNSTNMMLTITQSVVGLDLAVNPNIVNVNENVQAVLSYTGSVAAVTGVSCTIFTGDGRQYEDTGITLNSGYIFSAYFNYTTDYDEGVVVSVTCINAVSNKTVEKTIAVGTVIKSCSIHPPTSQRVGDSNVTVIFVQGGHDITVNVDFGDGEVESGSSTLPGDIHVLHSYTTVGNYNITAHASKSGSSDVVCSTTNATITVQEAVPAATNFILSAEPVAVNLSTEQRINFTLEFSDSQVIPEDVFITFLFSTDCTCSLSIALENYTTYIAAIYNTSGIFRVTAIIANRVSAVTKHIDVGAMYSINDMTISPSSSVINVGEVVTVDVNPEEGTEIVSNITWDDGSVDGNFTREAEVVTFSHSFDTVGIYEVCVSVKNMILDTPIQRCETVNVLYPVSGLIFTSSHEIITTPSNSNLKIDKEVGVNQPTLMTCVVDFGNGTSKIFDPPSLSSLPATISLGYPVEFRNYRIVLNCSNLLGFVEYTHVVQVKKPISEVFLLQVMNSFIWLSDGEAYYILSVRDGEPIQYGEAIIDLDYGDGKSNRVQTQLVNRNTNFNHSFTREGNFVTRVSISYGNGDWSGSLSLSVTIAQQRSLDVRVESVDGGNANTEQGPNQTWFYKNQDIQFTPVPQEDDTTYYWDIGSGNNTRTPFRHSFSKVGVYALHLVAKWPLYYSERLVIFLHIVSKFELDEISATDSGDANLKLKAYSKLNISLIGRDLDSPVCILWVFCNETLYFSGPPNCYGAAYNNDDAGLVWSSEGQLLAHIEFNSPGIYNISIIIWNNIDPVIEKMETITISGCVRPPRVTIKGSGENIDKPRLYLRSEYINLGATVSLKCYGLEKKPLFQWSTEDSESGMLTDLDTGGAPDYDFKPLKFLVGFYNVTMTVTITETSPPLSGMHFIYMRIAQSPLKVKINGGTARTVNGLKKITLNASGSVDPDEYSQDLNAWIFSWKCRRISPPYQNLPCQQSSFTPLENETGVVLEIAVNQLAIDVIYVIAVTGFHNNRNGTYEQRITTVEGDPVEATLLCIQNCQAKVSPTSPAAFQAKCLNCETESPIFRWKMYNDTQTPESVDLQKIADTELTKSGLVIRANTLEGGSFYAIRVYIEEPGKKEGFTEYQFYTNLPPYNGTCSISPPSGEALITDYTVVCSGWLDEGNEPTRPEPGTLDYEPLLNYRVFYRASGSQVYTQLASGEQGTLTGIKLQVGPAEHNYTFEVLFVVLDKFHGMKQTSGRVQVRQPQLTKDDLDQLLGEGGDLDQLLQSKDVDAGIRIISAASSATKGANLTQEEAKEVNSRMLNIAANLSETATNFGTINMFAQTYSGVYEPGGSVVLDETTTINVVASVSGMGNVISNFAEQSAEDIKRTTDALLGACGNLMAISTSPSKTNTTGSNSEESINIIQGTVSQMANKVLSTQVAGQAPSVAKTSTLEVQVQVNFPSDFGKDTITAHGAEVNLPQTFGGSDIDPTSPLQMKLIVYPESNPYINAATSDQISSGVTSLDLQRSPGDNVMVSNISQPISLILKMTKNQIPETVEISANISAKMPMSYHEINITYDYEDLRAIIIPEVSGSSVWVFARYQHTPFNESFDVKMKLPRILNDRENDSLSNETLREESRYTFSLTHDAHCGAGIYIIGIMPAGPDDHFKRLNSSLPFCSGEPDNVTRTVPLGANLTSSQFTYSWTVYTSACRYFNETTKDWGSDGCKTGEKTNQSQTECLCTHLTSFASSFFVPPNKIDFSTVFSKSLADNMPVLGTILAFAGIYLLLVIYARRKDKQDIIKWGVTPMSDNHPGHSYAYQITVETGVRPGAGTKSKVGIIVTGEDADSGARVLDDAKRPIFQAGSICSFLMTVPRPLGILTYVRIWHDNSGGGGQAGWFLSKVSVTDLQTGRDFFFICEQWLAVEQGDGAVDRTLFVASKKDMLKVGQLVYTSGRKNLSDQHLWFSLFSRPTRSQFNRCQRLCCCITLLYTSMIANAMFYRSESSTPHKTALRIGPFNVTPQQIYIGVVSSMIVMPVNMIIVQIFRKAKPLEPDKPDPLFDWFRRRFLAIKSKLMPISHSKLEQYNYEENRHEIAVAEKTQESCGDLDNPLPHSDEPQPPVQSSTEMPGKKKYPLPHWAVYFAYGLAFVSCFISCFFTTLYSLQWGKEKSIEWLTSMITSFFSSAFLIQPMKVIVIVFIVSIIFKKPSKMNDEAVDDIKEKSVNKLQPDEEYIHEESPTAGKAPAYAVRPKTPPTKQFLEEARKQRLRDIQASSISRDVLIYTIFLVVVLFLCYTNRDPDAFYMSQSIRNTFISDHVDFLVDGADPVNFNSLSQSKPVEFWKYVEQKLIPGLYHNKFYNGEPVALENERYIRDWQSYRVGPARLRQLRVKPLPCSIASRMEDTISDCSLGYSWSNEEEGIFAENWTYTCDAGGGNLPEYDFDEVDETKPWYYQSAIDLIGIPYQSDLYIYAGGGYVAEFGVTQDQALRTAKYLREHSWYDRYTRALFVEFTLYNANVNLFSVVTLLVETPTFGGGVPSYHVHTFRLYQYVGLLWVVSLGLQGIFCIYLVYFLAHFLYRLKKEGKKELKNFWTLLEMCMLLVGIGAVGMFVMRQIFIKFSLDEVAKKDQERFVNFSHISKWDQLLGYLLALLSFTGILRFMRVLRLSARVTHIAEALHLASRDLLYFLLMWFLILAAFGLWAYAVFSRSVKGFHTFQSTLESLLSTMLGSFDFYALQGAERIVGPFFFFLYIFVVFFILTNMLITIIVEAFLRVKAKPPGDDNFPITEHYMSKFKSFLAGYGIGSNSVGPKPMKSSEKSNENGEENEDEGPTYEDMMATMEKRVDLLVSYIITNYGEGKGGAMGSKATIGGDELYSFDAMVKNDIESARKKKLRSVFIS